MTTRTTIYTDGSALGNPGPGGWGWWIDDTRCALGSETGGDPSFTPRRTTNNRMELAAIAAALEAVDGPVEIVTDSTYARDALTKWVHGWKRRGWKTASGGPVKNRDLIEPLARVLATRDVTFTWVKGHATSHGNNRADELARQAATRQR